MAIVSLVFVMEHLILLTSEMAEIWLSPVYPNPFRLECMPRALMQYLYSIFIIVTTSYVSVQV